ncbi:uncharacterized protein LOC135138559 [Zophobas morio]|uniref:uncharacterized protein LOC135138559 n=1 Tax=Zophobas morio TaxID=2755281 RepID=UPI003083A79E
MIYFAWSPVLTNCGRPRRLLTSIALFSPISATVCREYLNQIEESMKNNPKDFWKYVHLQKGTTRIPGRLVYEDKQFEDPQEIVNAFAERFSDVFRPKTIIGISDVTSNKLSFAIPSVTEEQLIDIMSTFSNKMTAGDDQIPSVLIRDARYILAKPLSICCIKLSLLMSKVMYLRSNMDSGLVDQQLLSNLCILTQFLSEQLDNNGQVDVIYTDFSSAFDFINHTILLHKLSSFGFAPSFLKLLESYLSGRSNSVTYNGYHSFNFVSTSGVPQGSNLGPLLFVLFIDDLLLSLNCKVLAYADDLKLYCPISNSDDVKTFQRNLDTLVDWCNKSELLLNADKCYVMTFSRKVNVVKSDYTINGRILCKKNEVKDLGVLFDSRLSFVEHISNISTSASKMLGFIFRVSKTFQDPLLLKSLYFAYVVSKMEYASVVWYPYYVIHNLAVEKVQRRFLKYLSYKIDGFYPQRNIDYNYLLQKHGFVSLKNRREEHSARFISKLISGKIDCPELLERVNFHVPRVASRYMASFHQSISRTNLLRKAPLVHMCIYKDSF